MRFCVIGLSHRTAPIELRERYAQATRDLPRALAEICTLSVIDEACIVSTCNRVEYYVAGTADPPVLAQTLKMHLQEFSGLAPHELAEHLYIRQGEEAIQHLFRVASSLDSMVLGEPQILGQVKEAYRIAQEVGTSRANITRTFQKAFFVAKRVRTETGIAENAVSMSYAAVALGREIFDSLAGRQVLLVGAGKMAGLAARHLRASGVSSVRVVSRTMQNAQNLANEVGGLASSMTDLPLLLRDADIVISSTAAPGYIIDRAMMSNVIRARRYRSILFVDVAVPRDVDPQIAALDNCFVYDVDDLETVLEMNREERAKEAKAAHRLIDEELEAFVRWNRSQQVVPLIKALRRHAMEIATLEAGRTLATVTDADRRTQQSIKAMSNAIVNKLLHPVLTRLKEESALGNPQAMVDTLAEIFELDLSDEADKPLAAESREAKPAEVVPLRRSRAQGDEG